MAQVATGGQRTYLSINAKGEFYETSKVEAEGFVKVEKKDGGHTFHKLYKSTDIGKITFMDIVEKTFPTGPAKYFVVNITCRETGASDSLSFPLMKMNGSINDTLKKFITIMPNIDYTKEFQLSCNKKPNDRNYVDKVLFLSECGTNEAENTLVRAALRFGENGTIPPFEAEKDMLDDSKIKYNYSKQDAYLIGILKEELQRYKESKAEGVNIPSKYSTVQQTVSEKPAESVSVAEKPKKAVKEVTEETDDLPF